MDPSYATFQARLDTFAAPKTKSRRPSIRGKKAAPKPAKGGWPLEFPRPEDLAFAGFIYKPTSASPDNVQCFSCLTQLDGWEENDVPAHEHLTHSPNCGFAINVCIRLRGSDPGRTEDDPLSDRMMESRRETFAEWPLDVEVGYPNIDQMAAAGWYFDPGVDTPDGATCPYCNLSLDAWEIGDDPVEEHRKRSEDCLFFTLKEYYHPTQKPKASRSKRASTRSSTASTKAKKSTRAKKGTDKPLPNPPDESMMDYTVGAYPDVSMVSSKAPAAKRGRKAQNASILDDTIMGSVADSFAGGATLSMVSIPAKAPPAKRGRKPKNSSMIDETQIADTVVEPAAPEPEPEPVPEPVSEPVEEAIEEPVKAPAKRGRKPKKASGQEASVLESFTGSVASTASKAPAKTRQSRKNAKRTSTVSAASATRTTRGAKRKSSEMDMEMEVEQDMDMEGPEHESAPSPKRTRLSDISLPPLESTPVHTPVEYRQARQAAQAAQAAALKSPFTYVKEHTPRGIRQVENLKSSTQAPVRSPLATSPMRGQPQTPDEPCTPEGPASPAMVWHPAVLANIITDAGLDQENMGIDVGDTTENITKAVLASLTSPEKRMNIEEFVLHNAKRGEEKLRRECQRQIAAFEAEGRRALAALDAY